MIGTVLGPYRIDSEAGAGGMGVVYRATDTTLKRPVAIKVLAAAAALDPDRKRRFIQEAQAASALNHSDIVTIYQIGRDAGIDFIAMEFVPGRSLDAVIAGRPLKPADAVRYGARIAGALAAAHRAGIVHRDLKPANVMITDAGGVKLLDFGVAKLTEPLSDGGTTAEMGAATATGMVVGTLAYMSPEQRDGAAVDARSDIYAFGLVLHEMITGRRPAGDVDPSSLASAPRDLHRIVRRCLQLDPDHRFQAMEDVRYALEDADVSAGAPAPAAASARRWLVAAGIVLGVIGLMGAAAFAAWKLAPGAAAPSRVLTRLTTDSGLTTDPVLSPDGRFIAFASDRAGSGNLDIWIRQVAGGDPVRLTTDPADDIEPSFSPDGSRIAFRSDRDGGGVYVMSALGGDARRVADGGRRPRWSPDGSQIAYWTGLNTAFLITKADAPRVYVVPATGGEARRLFADFARAYYPIWSADGSRLLFVGARDNAADADFHVASADGTSPVVTGAVRAVLNANVASVDGMLIPDAWGADGRVMFSGRVGDATNVLALRIDGSGHATGAPARITAGTAIESGATMDAQGALAFAAIDTDIDLWSLPLDPATGTANGPPQRLTRDPAMDVYPWLSADGRMVAYASNRSGTYDVWIRDLAAGKDSVIAARVGFPSLPTFTNDGLRVTFHSTTKGRWLSTPVAAAAGRSTAPQVVCEDCESFWDVTADGWAVFVNDRDTHLFTRNIATGQTVDLARVPDQIFGRFKLSPDGRWLTFTHRDAGSVRVVVMPYQRTGPIPRDRWIPITPEDAFVNAPTFSADSGTVYYLSNRDGAVCVWAQRLDPETGRPRGEAFAVWHLHEASHSLWRIPMPLRGLTAARDRLIVSIAESSGNIWLAK